MIVGYDGIRAALNPSGLGNYSRFILDTVERHLEGVLPLVYVPVREGAGRFRPTGRTQIRRPRPWPGDLVARTLWRRRLAAPAAREGAAIFHGLSNELPAGLPRHDLRGVVTVHDLIYLRYPRYFSAIDRRLYDRRYRRSVAAADRIIAVSRQTADDLVCFFGVAASRIDVVGQGCDAACYDIQRQPASEPFVLYVGAFDPRKNIDLIVDAAARLRDRDVRFVLAGRRTGDARRIERRIQEMGLDGRVRLEFDVSNERLRELYAGAHVFVYPSEFEGFGIPLLEAMAAGVPVVTARRSSLPEVCGDAASYLEHDDPAELAGRIWNLIADRTAAEDLTRRGRERAAVFLPERIAEQLAGVYDAVGAA